MCILFNENIIPSRRLEPSTPRLVTRRMTISTRTKWNKNHLLCNLFNESRIHALFFLSRQSECGLWPGCRVVYHAVTASQNTHSSMPCLPSATQAGWALVQTIEPCCALSIDGTRLRSRLISL